MWDLAVSLAIQSATIIKNALLVLLPPAVFFGGLAAIFKGLLPAFAAAKSAFRETRVNLTIYILDALIVGPFLVIAYASTSKLADSAGLRLISPHAWTNVPYVVVGFTAVFAGDFIGYWRHRSEHTRFLWPSHALHHSDTAMTWLALLRFHPINRVTTFVVDTSVLLLLGFPDYALLTYAAVKHYYGYFIHADLPWSYGPLDLLFVSPVMHRWHHSIDPSAYQTNFASVFSIFDRIFGTYRVPGLPTGALGVKPDIGPGLLAQLVHPLKPSAYRSMSDVAKEEILDSTPQDASERVLNSIGPSLTQNTQNVRVQGAQMNQA